MSSVLERNGINNVTIVAFIFIIITYVKNNFKYNGYMLLIRGR